MILIELEIVDLSRKKKSLRKKEKGEKNCSEVEFRIYEVEKIGRRCRRRMGKKGKFIRKKYCKSQMTLQT